MMGVLKFSLAIPNSLPINLITLSYLTKPNTERSTNQLERKSIRLS